MNQTAHQVKFLQLAETISALNKKASKQTKQLAVLLLGEGFDLFL